MSTATATSPAQVSELTAITVGLTALCIGTVGLIGATGLMMWILGL